MKISVIVPAYNAEKTIERCIDSILNQTLKSLEVIVIDDGSVDNTEAVCKKYIHDGRFHYHKKENGGPSSARNLGLSLAQGEYVGFVDSDDEVAPEMYESMYNSCVENNAELGVCDIERFRDGVSVKKDTDSRRGGVFNKDQIREEILPYCLGHVGESGRIENFDWSVLRHIFKRDFLFENSICFDESLKNSEDCLFVYESICNANNIVYHKGYYYYYNIIGDSLTRKYLPVYWEQRKYLIDRIIEISTKSIVDFRIESIDCFVLRCAYASASNVSLGFAQNSGAKSYKEYKSIISYPLVFDVANRVSIEKLGFDWARFISFIRRKQCLSMYYYYKDVYGKSGWHHMIRNVFKKIKRVAWRIKV